MKYSDLFRNFTESLKESQEINFKDNNYLGDVSDAFAEDLSELINELIRDELTEQFVSRKDLSVHFKRHCIGKSKNKKSTRQKVFYDFTNINDFSNYENIINKKCINSDICIGSLTNTVVILKAFRKLFEGNYTIEFSTRCGFENNNGPVDICINSFATDVTENYMDGNTVNIVILSKSMNTISMYAVDANYLENKFNSIVAKYSKNKQIQKFSFNH